MRLNRGKQDLNFHPVGTEFILRIFINSQVLGRLDCPAPIFLNYLYWDCDYFFVHKEKSKLKLVRYR